MSISSDISAPSFIATAQRLVSRGNNSHCPRYNEKYFGKPLALKDKELCFFKDSRYALYFEKKGLDLTQKKIAIVLVSLPYRKKALTFYPETLLEKTLLVEKNAVLFLFSELSKTSTTEHIPFQFFVTIDDSNSQKRETFVSSKFLLLGTRRKTDLPVSQKTAYLYFFPRNLQQEHENLKLERAQAIINLNPLDPVLNLLLKSAYELLEEPLEFRRQLRIFCDYLVTLSRKRIEEICLNRNNEHYVYTASNEEELQKLQYIRDFIFRYPQNVFILKAFELALIEETNPSAHKDYEELGLMLENSSSNFTVEAFKYFEKL